MGNKAVGREEGTDFFPPSILDTVDVNEEQGKHFPTVLVDVGEGRNFGSFLSCFSAAGGMYLRAALASLGSLQGRNLDGAGHFTLFIKSHSITSHLCRGNP